MLIPLHAFVCLLPLPSGMLSDTQHDPIRRDGNREYERENEKNSHINTTKPCCSSYAITI
jgi:hypothetical protein